MTVLTTILCVCQKSPFIAHISPTQNYLSCLISPFPLHWNKFCLFPSFKCKILLGLLKLTSFDPCLSNAFLLVYIFFTYNTNHFLQVLLNICQCFYDFWYFLLTVMVMFSFCIYFFPRAYLFLCPI